MVKTIQTTPNPETTPKKYTKDQIRGNRLKALGAGAALLVTGGLLVNKAQDVYTASNKLPRVEIAAPGEELKDVDPTCEVVMVQPDDTIWEIAQEINPDSRTKTVDAIVAENGSDKIDPGTKIEVC